MNDDRDLTAEIKNALTRMSPGPWVADIDDPETPRAFWTGKFYVGSGPTESTWATYDSDPHDIFNAVGIALLVTEVPALVAEVEELRRGAHDAALARVEAARLSTELALAEQQVAEAKADAHDRQDALAPWKAKWTAVADALGLEPGEFDAAAAVQKLRDGLADAEDRARTADTMFVQAVVERGDALRLRDRALAEVCRLEAEQDRSLLDARERRDLDRATLRDVETEREFAAKERDAWRELALARGPRNPNRRSLEEAAAVDRLERLGVRLAGEWS